ncbi:MAG TPA: MBL fold metallo-hydrolase [Streptosporangiaceae bacterium]|jgi:L-ascorbate metabolism protein UlaG (beta-lactamase superfamily)
MFEQPGVTFIGNATTVISYGGFTLLTDPNFLRRGDRAHLGYGLTSKRLADPAVTIGQLPELDGVVLSHLHDDHWDRVADRELDRELPVLTTEAAARTLRSRGFAAADGLRPWDDRVLVKDDRQVRITALPGRHAPGALLRLLPPVMGTLLEFGARGADPELRVYISGDTLMFDGIAEIARRCPAIDLGIVHLGGTKLLGLVMVTMNGKQGADWLQTVDCARAMPVHFDDYTVFRSPLSDFQAEVRRRGLADRVETVARGATLPLTARVSRPPE